MAFSDTVNARICERERTTLSPFAFLTENTKGRLVPAPLSPVRTEFQRDRDKIIHSKSFRRMMHKTQVFFFPNDEHYRNRLTHSLEVTQIARVIARGLFLNEDLVEAAALGHDLGHTPFGHAGEVAMQQCYDPSFRHYKQSLRVVDCLEKNGEGLNLTYEVRDAILNHTGDCIASTLEGVIVKYADRIAYINHDIDDAFRAGILTSGDLPADLVAILGNNGSERIDTMVSSVIEASTDSPEIRMTEKVGDAMMRLRDFLTEKVYKDIRVKAEEQKARDLIRYLYEHYCQKPEEMPPFYRDRCEKEGVERTVCDYISGMTDRYAIDQFTSLRIPSTLAISND